MGRAGNKRCCPPIFCIALDRHYDFIGVGNAGKRPFAFESSIVACVFGTFGASQTTSDQFCVLRRQQLWQLCRVQARQSWRSAHKFCGHWIEHQ